MKGTGLMFGALPAAPGKDEDTVDTGLPPANIDSWEEDKGVVLTNVGGALNWT